MASCSENRKQDSGLSSTRLLATVVMNHYVEVLLCGKSPRLRMTILEGRGLLVFVDGDELNDFESFLARGRGDLDFIADLPIEKGFADWRGCGDVAFFRVDFLAADEFVFDLDVLIGVENKNAGAVAGTVFRNVGEI